LAVCIVADLETLCHVGFSPPEVFVKRWDVSNLATNVGHRLNSELGQAWVDIEQVSKIVGPGYNELINRLIIRLNEITRLADVVVGAASSRYPLEGTEPWMFEGNASAIRLRLEHASRKEVLATLIGSTFERRAEMFAAFQNEWRDQVIYQISQEPDGQNIPALDGLLRDVAELIELGTAFYRLFCGHSLSPEVRESLRSNRSAYSRVADFLDAEIASEAKRDQELALATKEVEVAQQLAAQQAKARAAALNARLEMQRLATETKRKAAVEAKYGTDEARATARSAKAEEKRAERKAREEARKQRAAEKAAQRGLKTYRAEEASPRVEH
jgi:hypothetical protein